MIAHALLLLALNSGAADLAGMEIAPNDHAHEDIYIRFERAGYEGDIYLNDDGSYVIVQTGPDGRTAAYSGTWTSSGETGVCIRSADGATAKCVPHLPSLGEGMAEVTSDLDELYRFELRRGR